MSEEMRRGYNIKIYKAMPSSSTDEVSPQLNAVAGDSEGNEVLRIDDTNVPFLKTDQGYRIYYQPPEESLLEAARSYIDTQREKSE